MAPTRRMPGTRTAIVIRATSTTPKRMVPFFALAQAWADALVVHAVRADERRSITRSRRGSPLRRPFRVAAAVGCAILAVVLGCGVRQEKPHRELTERQRDSLIGESELPGAPVVKRALQTSDGAAERAAQLDSMSRP